MQLIHLQSLLNLALDFLLVTAPDLGTFEDPVLVTLQDLPAWSSHWQWGQNTKQHFGEEHWAFWKFCKFGLEPLGLKFWARETRLGLVHRGQCTNLSPGFNLRASSTNSLWRILEGEMMAELEGFLSLLPEFGDRKLMLATSCMILRGEVSLDLRANLTPRFSRSNFIAVTKLRRRSSWTLTELRERFHNWETWVDNL